MIWEWQWVFVACFMVSPLAVTCCCFYYWRFLMTLEPPTVEIDLSQFAAPISEMRQIEPAAEVGLPTSDEEARGVGSRKRNSHPENLTADEVINAGSDETDVQGCSGNVVGATGPSGDASSKEKNKDKITKF